MNINEHMNQLGQIGSVGYAPTETVIDDLLSRTKRARAVRQGSAAIVGSVSALALGVVGRTGLRGHRPPERRRDPGPQPHRRRHLRLRQQVRLGLHRDRPGVQGFLREDLQGPQPRRADRRQAPRREAGGRGGALLPRPRLRATPRRAPPPACTKSTSGTAASSTAAPRRAARGCTRTSPRRRFPPGWIDFGGDLGQCKNYYDVAFGQDDLGRVHRRRRELQEDRPVRGRTDRLLVGELPLRLQRSDGGGWHATVGATTCTGYTATINGAPHSTAATPTRTTGS